MIKPFKIYFIFVQPKFKVDWIQRSQNVLHSTPELSFAFFSRNLFSSRKILRINQHLKSALGMNPCYLCDKSNLWPAADILNILLAAKFSNTGVKDTLQVQKRFLNWDDKLSRSSAKVTSGNTLDVLYSGQILPTGLILLFRVNLHAKCWKSMYQPWLFMTEAQNWLKIKSE